MDKLFRGFCVLMSVIILVCSIAMPISIIKADDNSFLRDPFGSEEIIEKIKNFEINLTSIIYVKDDKGEWEEYQRIHGDENRIWIGFENFPDKLIDAFVAIEDERFYTHSGVDWKRTTKAIANKIFKLGGGVFGGSSITQQLIKNITGDNSRTSKRKVREIIRALTIEKKLSKEEILEAYLNTISLGNGICGVQVASNYYFNKDVVELTLTECAALAAITKNPTAYNPVSKPKGNKTRRNTVLAKMYELDMITGRDYLEAIETELIMDDSQKDDFEVPVNSYFVDTLIDNVITDLSEKYNCSKSLASTMLYNGGYKIYATVDSSVQSIMESVYNNVGKYFSQKATVKGQRGKSVQSAMTVMDYEGHIIGIVGGVGKKTENRGLNRATDSPRQPGSTMKPLGAYTPALENGIITEMEYMVDSPLESYYPDGKKGPKEWYGYYAGRMTIQSALERSANTIPCKIIKEMGLDISYKFLTETLGFKHITDQDKNLASLALGGSVRGITTTESASAYAMFGNKGKIFKPVTYYKIERPNGEIELECDKKGKQVINPGTATIMNSMLQRVVYGSQGTGKKISSYSKMKAYAKTGTSSECNDLWMVAGTPYYIGSVWYGFDMQEEVYNVYAAADVWKAVMQQVHKDLEHKEFELSDNVETKKYCRITGKLAGEKCKSTKDGQFISGIEVEVCDGVHSKMEDEDIVSSSSEEGSNESTSETPPDTNLQSPTPSDTIPPSAETPIETPTVPPSDEGQEENGGGQGGTTDDDEDAGDSDTPVNTPTPPQTDQSGDKDSQTTPDIT